MGKQGKQRPYLVCGKCNDSWIFASRVVAGEVTHCENKSCGAKWTVPKDIRARLAKEKPRTDRSTSRGPSGAGSSKGSKPDISKEQWTALLELADDLPGGHDVVARLQELRLAEKPPQPTLNEAHQAFAKKHRLALEAARKCAELEDALAKQQLVLLQAVAR